MQTPSLPILHKGDLIRIVSPAKAIETELIEAAKSWFEAHGFHVKLGNHVTGSCGYFSGTDDDRLADLQDALDDESCKAIICARGGYGSIRLVDQLDWAGFIASPKWVCGFSDITVLHNRVQLLGFPSLHCTMPLNFASNTMEAKASMLNALCGKQNTYRFAASPNNVIGEVEGTLVGGNLSILYALLGTNDQLNYKNVILVIEDVGEQLYAIDRMLYAFKKAGVFNQIKGLIVGGMTELKDTAAPTGFTAVSIVLNQIKDLNIPVCFDFPVGHISDNRALIMGKKALLQVTASDVVLKQ